MRHRFGQTLLEANAIDLTQNLLDALLGHRSAAQVTAITNRNALPDDVETLKRLVIGRDEMIAKLIADIVRLKRLRFGHSAERVDATLVQF